VSKSPSQVTSTRRADINNFLSGVLTTEEQTIKQYFDAGLKVTTVFFNTTPTCPAAVTRSLLTLRVALLVTVSKESWQLLQHPAGPPQEEEEWSLRHRQ
jgi:hypothetical protein